MSRRVLMLCPYFVPSASVATKRSLRFVRHLRDFGWEPIVLTVEGSAGGGIDHRQRDFLPDGLTVSRRYGGLSWALWRLVEDRKARARGRGENAKTISPQKIKLLDDIIDLTFDLTPLDRFVPYLYSATTEAIRLVNEHNAELIYVSASPFSGLLAGALVKRVTRRPLLFDMRDPWTLDPLDFPKKPQLLQSLERRLEQKVLQQADRIVCNTTRAKEAYQALYPDLSSKLFTLRNGFDRELFSESKAKPPEAGFSLVHFGNFYRHRMIRPLLLVLREFPTMKIVVYGTFRPEDLSLAEELGVRHQMEERKTVPYHQAMQVLEGASALLLVQSEETDLQIPAKLYDYLCARRPIVALAQNPEVGEILTETGAGEMVSWSQPEKLKEIFSRWVRGQTPRPRPEALSPYEAHTQTQTLAQHFDAVCR